MIISRDPVIPPSNDCAVGLLFLQKHEVSGLGGWRNFHNSLGYKRTTASGPLSFP